MNELKWFLLVGGGAVVAYLLLRKPAVNADGCPAGTYAKFVADSMMNCLNNGQIGCGPVTGHTECTPGTKPLLAPVKAPAQDQTASWKITGPIAGWR